MTEVSTPAPRPAYENPVYNHTGYDMDQTDVALPVVEPASSDSTLDNGLSTSTLPGNGSSGSSGSSISTFSDTASSTLHDARETLHDAGEKVSAFAGEAADRAGDYAQSAAAATTKFAGDVADRLRNNAELPNERGTTTIADEVVEKIAGFATREVEGIYDLGGDVARVFASVKERIGLGDKDDDSDRGVTVRLEGKNANIKIVIVIEYGYVVYTVCEQVRTKVIDKVESLLGLDVTAVDIVVDDIHIDDSKFAPTAKKP
jgi:uncharacterized alkaline shock family protein YloU